MLSICINRIEFILESSPVFHACTRPRSPAQPADAQAQRPSGEKGGGGGVGFGNGRRKMWAGTTTTVMAATAATAVLCVTRRCTQGTEEEESPSSLLSTPASAMTRPTDLLRPSDQRLGALEQSLEFIVKVLAKSSVGSRKQRRGLIQRAQAQLDSVDDATAEWLQSDWTDGQAASVAQAIGRVNAPNASNDSDALQVSLELLDALGALATLHDRAEQLAIVLKAGGEEAEAVLAEALEHGVNIMRAGSTPRRKRKVILLLSNRAEHVLDQLEESETVRGDALAANETANLLRLAEHICAVEKLKVDQNSECVPAMEALLTEIGRCCDPVLISMGLISRSSSASDQLRGLTVLSGLARKPSAEASAAEITAAEAVSRLLTSTMETELTVAAEMLSFLSLFALSLRNGPEASMSVLTDSKLTQVCVTTRELGPDKSDDKDSVILTFLRHAGSLMWMWDMGSKSPPGALRDAYVTTWTELMAYLSNRAFVHMTADRFQNFLQVAIEQMKVSDDTYIKCGLAATIGCGIGYSPHLSFKSFALQQGQLLQLVLDIWRQFPPYLLSNQWWEQRASVLDLELCCASFYFVFAMHYAIQLRAEPPPTVLAPQFREMIMLVVSTSISVAKINATAQLSRRPTMSHAPVFFSMRVLVNAVALDSATREMVLTSKAVPALLWASANDFDFAGVTIAGYAAATAASLVGRNDEGLMLTREAVTTVLRNWLQYTDPANRRFAYPAYKIVTDADVVCDLAISDANKRFIIEHDGVFEGLIFFLLLDSSEPRSAQKGASEVQLISVRTLQNLALSPVGATPMLAHAGVMTALRQLAEGGMTEEAKQCASSVLFQLDEQVRSTVVATQQRIGGSVAEHIMLSYNWDHQPTIKRINASLHSHGYTVWIDIEKMQGSTVEAMSAAVEGAAVMCYGISRAYKESANCRLEAQYAYQRQKEMVPLMVEEGYCADGWLGMLLGTRVWYAFCGSVLSSDALFEGKMEELRRELGDRGQHTFISAADSSSLPLDKLAAALVGEPTARVPAVINGLECSTQLLSTLQSVPRKVRQEMMQRGDVLQDALEEHSAPWLLSLGEQGVSAIAKAIVAVKVLAASSEQHDHNAVLEVVDTLMKTVEVLVSSHVTVAELVLERTYILRETPC
eukprot:COSAG05_NODE_935_length_6533_cov_123.704694_3_plen_1143_part_00